MFTLSADLQKLAEIELNEVPTRVQEDLDYFKEWLSKQPHIKARMDDKWLLTFLRTSKWSLEKAKKKIDLFYTIRTALPWTFKNRDPFLPAIQHALEQNILTILPPTTSDGPLLIIIKGRADPDIFNMEDVLKFITMVFDMMIHEYSNFIVGQIIWYDFKNISPKYVTQVTPIILQKIVTFYKAYPARLKAFYFVNVPSMFMYMSNILKSIGPKKIVERLHFFTDDGAGYFEKHVPISLVPIDCGGHGPPLSSAQLKSQLERYRDWFIEDEQYGCDESKRPATSKHDIDLFGINGSFRKIDID